MDSSDRTVDQHVRSGFVPFVSGENVRVERGGGIAFLARQHLTVEQGGGQWLVSAGRLDLRQGGGAVLVARTAHVESGFLGVLIGKDVRLGPGARVLLRATPAVIVAATAGLVVGWLCGRRRPHQGHTR